MSMLKCRIVTDGIFVPAGMVSKFDLVYGSDLSLVEESALRRGEGKSEDTSLVPPESLPARLIASNSIVDERLIFLGSYDVSHYGHWLTEGIARYWYLLSENRGRFKVGLTWNRRQILRRIRDRMLHHKTTHWPAATRAFNLRAQDFVRIGKPMRFSEIHIPQCSMVNRREIHGPHLDVTRKIAAYVTNGRTFVPDTRPVYLSRTKLKKRGRSYLNEEPIEAACRGMGFRIVHPERLSLARQIEIFNSSDVFAGFVGSAFHSIMFRQSERPATSYYLGDGRRHPNCDLIDSLMGNKSVYVNCCERGPQRSFRCDSEKAVTVLTAALKQSGAS